MLRRTLVAAVLGVALAGPAAAHATAPNDSWQTPDDLYFQADGTATTTDYGTQLGEPVAPTSAPACPRMGRTAWWQITGNGRPITLTTAVGATDFNTVLAVLTGTPAAYSRFACNDDRVGGDPLHRSELTFNSVRGTVYHVQVGGLDTCDPPLSSCAESGTLELHASSVRPLNDDYLSPADLITGVPNTTSNVGATLERAESSTCGTSHFAATVWYRWTAPGTGDAVFRSAASFGPTMLGVYRGDTGARVGCAASTVSMRVRSGAYWLQVGAPGVEGTTPIGEGNVEGKVDFAPDADGDGASTQTDCNDADPGIRPGAPEVAGNGIDEDCDGADAALDPVQLAQAADQDGDHYPAGVDCRDDTAAIHPGAADTPGDGVDQDCSGGDAPFPRLDVRIAVDYAAAPTYTVFGVHLKRVPAGARVELRCKGHGCPFHTKRKKFAKRRASVNLTPLVAKAKLRRGARLEIRVTRPGYVGVVSTWTSRSPGRPKRAERCLPPGKSQPTRC